MVDMLPSRLYPKSIYPYEVKIDQFLLSELLRSDHANYCVPIYDVLSVLDDQDTMITCIDAQSHRLAPLGRR